MTPSSVLPLHGGPKQSVPLNGSQPPATQGFDVAITSLKQANLDLSHLYDDGGTYQRHELAERGLIRKINDFRERLRHVLHLATFHYTIICLVVFDLIVVFIDLVISLLDLPCYREDQQQYFEQQGLDNVPQPSTCKLPESTALTDGEWFLWSLSVFLLSVFTIELIASGFAFGLRHFKKPIYAIDAFVVSASLVLEIYFKVGDSGKLENAPSAVIALRLWKIVRAVHAIAHSIELKNRETIRKVRAAKEQVEASYQQVEASYQNAIDALQREKLKNSYLRQKAPEIHDVELEHYVQKGIQEKESGTDLANEKDAWRAADAV